MKKRVLAIMLAVATVTGGQGSLMYAATLRSAELPASAQADQPAAEQMAPQLATSPSFVPDVILDGAFECLRGGDACFGIGSEGCCGEMVALAGIAGAVGAWLAAGVAAYYVYEYC